jgi:hypothetical protein
VLGLGGAAAAREVGRHLGHLPGDTVAGAQHTVADGRTLHATQVCDLLVGEPLQTQSRNDQLVWRQTRQHLGKAFLPDQQLARVRGDQHYDNLLPPCIMSKVGGKQGPRALRLRPPGPAIRERRTAKPTQVSSYST